MTDEGPILDSAAAVMNIGRFSRELAKSLEVLNQWCERLQLLIGDHVGWALPGDRRGAS